MAKIIKLEKDAGGNLLPFTAGKNRYVPIQLGSDIGILRWNQYEKLKIVLGFGKTFSSIVQALGEIELLAASDKPLAEVRLEIILLTNSLKRGILELSRERYSQAFYLCTLFIPREGDDLTEWSIEMANDYVEEWQTSGVSEKDLFFFALSMVDGFQEIYKEERLRQDLSLEKLQGISGNKGESIS